MNILKNIITTFLISLLIFAGIELKAQLTELQYFSDSVSGSGIDYIFSHEKLSDGIIISGYKKNGNLGNPVLMKLDLNGDIVWSTYPSATFNYHNCNGFSFKMFNDGYVYGISTDYNWPDYFRRLWKVDPLNGAVIWTKPFYNYYFTGSPRREIAEYDSTGFLYAYKTPSDFSAVAMISKTTGDTLWTKTFQESTSYYNIAIDQHKNIYLSIEGHLMKFNKDNLNQKIWEYDFQNTIHELYLDRFDDLYVFRRDGGTFGHGRGIIDKVDQQTGEIKWTALGTSDPFSEDVIMADYKDFNNCIYATYQHSLVGGSTFKYTTTRTDKQNGNVIWEKYYSVTGFYNGTQSALSLDYDCLGNFYLTGYCGASNYGPGVWSIMKMAGNSGAKLYDLIITEDTTTVDTYSSGIAACVFGNSPVFLGNIEVAANTSLPMYVTIDPTTGDVIRRMYVGGNFQFPSSVIDIVRDNNDIFIFKQKGEIVVVEKYNVNYNLIWRREFSGTGYIKGRQIRVTNNFVYLTLTENPYDANPPYYSSNTQSTSVYKLSRTNGQITDNDYLSYTPQQLFPFEMEASDGSAFIFIYTNNSAKLLRWESSSLSPLYNIEASSGNHLYQGGVDLVFDNGSDSLIYAGKDSLYSINKNNMQVQGFASFPDERKYYDSHENSGKLYLCGSNQTGRQIISEYDLSAMSLIDFSYPQTGYFGRIVSDSQQYLYAAGSDSGRYSLRRISASTGNVIWLYENNTLIPDSAIVCDLEIIEDNHYLAFAGAGKYPSNASDAVFGIIDTNGTVINEYLFCDEIGETSCATSIETLPDSSFLIGGSYNQILYSRRGFIYNLKHVFPDSVVSSGNLSAVNAGVYISPNPHSEYTVLYGIEDGTFSYTICDLMGKKCEFKSATSDRKIDISALPAGMYIITAEQKNKRYSLKFIRSTQ